MMKRNSCVECPIELLVALDKIADAMVETQPSGLGTPFDNNQKKFSNSTFSVQSHVSGEFIPYNFKWKDIEVSWYIELGRLTTVNREVTNEEVNKLTYECLNSLKGIEV